MCRSIRLAGVRGFQCCAFLCVGLIAAQSALAGPDWRSKSEAPAAKDREQIQTLMTGKGIGVAPYSVRLRITGFLARQHARDGDKHRALLEFHSILNVDDPAWPDNPDGDSMRIARDIDVAQMMSEAGFYDHAIRVLQTTFILARVNEDPQAAVVERQMLATVELAQLKGIVVPSVNLSYAEIDVKSEQRSALEPTQVPPVTPAEAVTTAFSESDTAVADAKSEPSSLTPRSLPDLSAPSAQQNGAQESPPAETKSKERFRLSKLLPMRRHQSKNGVVEATPPATTAPRVQPWTTPDVVPTYCSACAAAHHGAAQPRTTASTHARPRLDRMVRQPSSHVAMDSKSTMKPMSGAQTRTADSLTLSNLPVRKRSGDTQQQTVIASKSSQKAGSSLQPSVVTEATEATTKPPADSELQLTTQLEGATSPQRTAEDRLETEMTNDGPTLQTPDASTATDSNADVKESASEPVRQVAVAGQVPKPGIFVLEGTSTTLAALLRRAGDESTGSAKHTRILRSVNLHRATDAVDPEKDFYLQRVEVFQSTGNELETPIYGQELVIVDGSGQKPIYVAVMPHFVLQIPASTSHPVTAEQIVDQLRVYWPNIRQQEIGVIRFEEWSRASKIARVKDADTSIEAAVQGGDVLYVDGLSLHRSQVLPAAEAIARLAGAKIRSHDPRVQQTGGSSD